MKAKLIPVQRKFLIRTEAMEYLGVKEDVFKRLTSNISVYAKNKKLVWYNVSDLDRIIEKSLIIKKPTAQTVSY